MPVRDKFTTKEFDTEGGMGLYYFGARYYDPEIATWTSTDPKEQDWHSYAYCGGNPVNLVDPDGRLVEQIVNSSFVMVGNEMVVTVRVASAAISTGGILSAWMIGSQLGQIFYQSYLQQQLFGEAKNPYNSDWAQEQWQKNSPLRSEQAAEPAAEPGAAGDLPETPDDLKDRGYDETTHPDNESGSRDFQNKTTGDKVRHDPGKPEETGWKQTDHYHRYNPNKTGKSDYYLDKNGSPAPKGSDASHLIPKIKK